VVQDESAIQESATRIMLFQFIETIPSIVNQLHECICKNVFRKKAIDSRTLILTEYSSAGIKSLSWLRAVLDDTSLYRLELIPGRTR